MAFKNKSNSSTTFNNLVQITLKANTNIKDVISYFDNINIDIIYAVTDDIEVVKEDINNFLNTSSQVPLYYIHLLWYELFLIS